MSAIILFDAAREALAECKSVDEVKGWADRAAATQAYARMAKDKSLEVDAAEIRIRAERRLGEMLAEQKATHGLNQGGRPKTGAVEEPVSTKAPTLEEVGIDKKLSARAQKIAKVPEAEFEAEMGQWRERVSAEGERVTARLEQRGAEVSKGDEEEILEQVADNAAQAALAAQRMEDAALELEHALNIIHADDKLAAAWDEVKTLSRKYEELEKLYESQRRELAEMTREAKRWMKKAQALEKGRAA